MRIVTLFVCILLACDFACGQDKAKQAGTPSGSLPSASPTAEQQRLAAVLTSRNIAARLLEVSDIKFKAPALAQLGDLLWRDDEPYARQLLLKAYELTANTDGIAPAESRKLAALRREILGPIAHRDPKLAKSLIEKEKDTSTDSQRAETNLSIAYHLLDSYGDIQGAEGFARAGMSQGIKISQLTVWLLDLRKTNQRGADAFFQDLIRVLVGQPAVDANDILYLGTYLFTSPRVFSSDSTARAVTIIGGVPVPDITADRPNVSASLVREYLSAVTSMLLREVTDPRQQKLQYVTAYLLIPKAERFAPDLLPALWKAKQMLSEQVPQALTQPQTYANLNKPTFDDQGDIDRVVEEIRKLPDQTRRDVRYLSLAFTLWTKGNFPKAREVSNKISDLNVQGELNCVIDFGDAAQQLDDSSKDLDSGENRAKKLLCVLERAMLWLAIAKGRKESGYKQHTREALAQALIAARSLEDARRAYLLLNVAGQFASFDSDTAQLILREAVKEFNQQKAETLLAVTWNREITVGPLAQRFALKVKGVDLGFEKNLQLLMAKDPESTMATIKTLTNEEPLTAGLLAVAKAILK